jgi:hypothetical protein
MRIGAASSSEWVEGSVDPADISGSMPTARYAVDSLCWIFSAAFEMTASQKSEDQKNEKESEIQERDFRQPEMTSPASFSPRTS